MINKVGSLQRTYPSFINFLKSYAFCKKKLGTILDTSRLKYVIEESKENEQEHTMWFISGTIQLYDYFIFAHQKRILLGQEMSWNVPSIPTRGKGQSTIKWTIIDLCRLVFISATTLTKCWRSYSLQCEYKLCTFSLLAIHKGAFLGLTSFFKGHI